MPSVLHYTYITFLVCILLGISPASDYQTLGKYPKEYRQDSKHGESLKSRITFLVYVLFHFQFSSCYVCDLQDLQYVFIGSLLLVVANTYCVCNTVLVVYSAGMWAR